MSSTATSRRASRGTSAASPSPTAAEAVRAPSAALAARRVHATLAEFFADLGVAGPERLALAFMRDHAGAVLVVPNAEAVERLAVERQVVRALDATGADDRTVARLARLHNTSRRTVAQTFKTAGGRGVAEVRRHARMARQAAAEAGDSGLMACRSPRLDRFRLVARV